jgi:hypothetical protein
MCFSRLGCVDTIPHDCILARSILNIFNHTKNPGEFLHQGFDLATAESPLIFPLPRRRQQDIKRVRQF